MSKPLGSRPNRWPPRRRISTKAREFLDQRVSLGWTNLDQAFAAVLKKAPADSQIVYIGDGIVTAGEANPVSFVKHLGELLTHSPTVAVGVHAVSVGNTSDSTVLRGIAAAGHGSVRAISGEQTPQIVAKELLNEISQPGLSDLTVEFRGLKVAAVYPDHLPQVPAGTQQILVGRYLPTGKDQHGEVIVTGTLGGEPVRYATQIDLKDAEDGNSFIPRLWARRISIICWSRDKAKPIRDQIIALSEQFHIITPYTSLLVLETDADRERFGVKRRFEMRDGERFFADGRDKCQLRTYATANETRRRLAHRPAAASFDELIDVRAQSCRCSNNSHRNSIGCPMPSEQRSAALEASPRFRMTSAWWSRRHGATGMNLECRPVLLERRLCAF